MSLSELIRSDMFFMVAIKGLYSAGEFAGGGWGGREERRGSLRPLLLKCFFFLFFSGDLKVLMRTE